MPMPMDYMSNWGPGMMVAMALASLVVLAAIVAGIVFLVRALSRRDQSGTAPRAVTILDERFARGEIDRDEYETKRRLLDKRAS